MSQQCTSCNCKCFYTSNEWATDRHQIEISCLVGVCFLDDDLIVSVYDMIFGYEVWQVSLELGLEPDSTIFYTFFSYRILDTSW